MIEFLAVPPTGHELANWVELRLAVDRVEAVTRSDLIRAMGLEPLVDEPPHEFNDFDLDDAPLAAEAAVRARVHDDDAANLSAADAAITDAMMELADRQRAMRDHSPYSVALDQVDARAAGVDLVHRFLALLAARLHYGISRELPAHEPAILFERLVTIALAKLLGNGRRFGWPYREDGIEGDFATAAKHLATAMGERTGKGYSVPPSAKDHGLDVAAWHSFGDDKPHQVVLLCQCGIGADVEDKALAIEVWTDVISFSSIPLKALAFPTQLTEWNEQKQFQQARRSGVLLDRVRLMTLVNDDDLADDLIEDIKQWCELAGSKLPRNTI